MRKTSMLAATVAGVALSSATVFAANLPVKAPPQLPPPPPIAYSWSGFYYGAHLGYGVADATTDTTHLPTPTAFGADEFSHNTRSKGWLGGLQAGYNTQSGDIIYGFEVDWSYSRLGGSSTYAPLPVLGGFTEGTAQSVNAELGWLGTARVRMGTGLSGALVYATAGAAYGRVDYATVTDYIGDPNRYAGALTKNKLGWTAGGGVEIGYSAGWTMKVEYLYFDLGSEVLTSSPAVANAPFQVVTDHQMTGHIVRVGMNYRFGGRF